MSEPTPPASPKIDAPRLKNHASILAERIFHHRAYIEREHAQNYQVVFVGSTFFKEYDPKGKDADSIRGREALRNVQRMLEKGYRLVLIEGGSSDAFRSALVGLKEKGDIRVEDEREKGGISPARQQGYRIASELSDCQYIVTSEIEKRLDIKRLIQPLRNREAQLAIPDRGSLRDYPSMQRSYEIWGASLLNRIAHVAGLIDKDTWGFDWHNGTRAFVNDPKILDFFTRQYDLTKSLKDYQVTQGTGEKKKLNLQMWFDAVYAPVFLMLAEGYKVVSVPIRYRHPRAQTRIETGDEEMNEKRRYQIQAIVIPAVELVRLILSQKQQPGLLTVNKKLVRIEQRAKKAIQEEQRETVAA